MLFDNDGVLVEPPAPETQRAAARERHDERSQIAAFRAGVYDDVPDLHAVAELV